MARNDNVVVVTGNVTRDPELRFTTAGTAVASFGVAWNDRRFRDGQWEDGEVSFFDVTVWSKLAENVAESVTKGDRVTITGKLRWRQWETEDNEKRSKVDIVADDVAPSLLFATAETTKVSASGGGGGGRSYGPPEDDDSRPF